MESLRALRQRIAATSAATGRNPAEITLVGVAKHQPVTHLLEAVADGLTDIGENYAQEMERHIQGLGPRDLGPVAWHFVGRLQRNKVKTVVRRAALIHSVDSLRLAREIDREAARAGKIQAILIEVKVAPEATKGGVLRGDLAGLLGQLAIAEHLKVEGLMALPPPPVSPEDSRSAFRALREIRDEMNEKRVYKEPLRQLSMGMSDDFQVAVEEGATIVRIGTALFGARETPGK